MTLSRTAETVLGLLVAAALAAAFCAVRGRQPSRDSDAPASPGAPGEAAGLPAADVSREDAVLDLGDLTLRVSAGPRPLVAFAANRYRVRAERGGVPVVLGEAVLSFVMTMPMGDHRHALVPAADGWQEAEAALPSCISGNRRWFATLSFTLDGRPRQARFAFELEPRSATDARAGTSR